MNKTRFALAATAASAVAGVLAPVAAQAAPQAAPQAASVTAPQPKPSGCNRVAAKKLYLYTSNKCAGTPFGYGTTSDSNYSDGQGSFQKKDDNKATSIINNTNRAVMFYGLKNYSHTSTVRKGYRFCLNPGKKVWSLSTDYAHYQTFRKWNNGRQANNQISSHKFLDKGKKC